MNETLRSAVSGLRSGRSRAVRAALLCCFAAGFFGHLFAITNLIPNPDGITRVYDAQQMTVSGRWFLHYASLWHGYIQAPALIGFFALLFLSCSAALTVSLLRVRSVPVAGLCGVMMALFPSVAYTFLYLFTASAYCFGLLLAVLAVWLAARFRFGWLFAAPLLACAVGTYQAYLAAAAALALIRVVLFALEGTHSAKEILLAALRMLGLLAVGLSLYFCILCLFLWAKDLTLLNYKGIGELGGGLGGLLSGVVAAYTTFFSYFFLPQRFAAYNTPAMIVFHAVLAAAALWAFARLLRRNRCAARPGALAMTLALCALLPLALNLTVLMGEAMPIMRYALVFTYVLALVLVERASLPAAEPTKAADAAPAAVEAVPLAAPEAPEPAAQADPAQPEAAPPAPAGNEKPKPPALLPRVAALCAALLICIACFQTDNLAYTVSATAHRSTESFATRLVERVESTPGYRAGMEVLIVGGFPMEVYHSSLQVFKLVADYSAPASSVIPLNKHIYAYLNDWLNVPWAEPAEAELIAVSDSAVFRAMPLYPDDGSVLITGGRVIVKLAEKYTPKQDFEIEYENRR